MKTIFAIIFYIFLGNWASPLLAQNRCTSLKQEKEQLARRMREIDEELRQSCGDQESIAECAERVLFTQGLEVKTQCAEIRGSTLTVHFTVRDGLADQPSQYYLFYRLSCLIFDQQGRAFQAKSLAISNYPVSGDKGVFELVYNIQYKGSAEFFIGDGNITNISLFKLEIQQGSKFSETLSFNDIEVKIH